MRIVLIPALEDHRSSHERLVPVLSNYLFALAQYVVLSFLFPSLAGSRLIALEYPSRYRWGFYDLWQLLSTDSR